MLHPQFSLFKKNHRVHVHIAQRIEKREEKLCFQKNSWLNGKSIYIRFNRLFELSVDKNIKSNIN
jgi:hypothetical protein